MGHKLLFMADAKTGTCQGCGQTFRQTAGKCAVDLLFARLFGTRRSVGCVRRQLRDVEASTDAQQGDRRFMQERYLKVNVNFSWHLVWLFALLEGITVPLVPLFLKSGPSVSSTAHIATVAAQFASSANKMMIIGIYGISIGFIGTSIVCLLLNYIVLRKVRVQLNNAVIMRVSHAFVVGLWGGYLLAVIFWIQQCIGSLLVFSLIVNLMLLGFVSAAGSYHRY